MNQIPEKLPPGVMIVRWLCNGIPPLETMELCGLRELRKSRLHHTNGKTYRVLGAWRSDKKTMVASCWEVPPTKQFNSAISAPFGAKMEPKPGL